MGINFLGYYMGGIGYCLPVTISNFDFIYSKTRKVKQKHYIYPIATFRHMGNLLFNTKYIRSFKQKI